MNKMVSGVVLSVLLCLAGQLCGQDAGPASRPAWPVELGKRYLDPIRGFSLCPPANTDRVSTARLTSWSFRDEKTGAIAWNMTISWAVEARKDIDLSQYAKAVAKRLAEAEAYRVEQLRLDPVAGRAAMDLQGFTEGAAGLWKRHVWIVADMPGEAEAVSGTMFLILGIAGPADRKADLLAISDAVLATLKLVDAKAELKARKDNLNRGQKLLASLTDAEYRAAVRAEPRWFLMRLKGLPVGYLYQAEAPARREGSEGFEIRSFIFTRLPNDEPRRVKRTLFTTADRSLELWKEDLLIGTGEKALTMVEDGIKQHDLILCNVVRCDQERTFKKKVPVDIYLPQASAILLPRMMDLKSPEAHAFAVYTSRANEFDMRTIQVAGPESLAVGGSTVAAVRLTDQPAADAEPASLWVDAKGNLLRLQTADGLTMDAADKAEILRQFPEAAQHVKELDK